MSAAAVAQRINQRFRAGDTFAWAIYGWAGTPWRPSDTSVGFRRCWAEGEVLCIEVTQPYGDDSTSMLVRIHQPGGKIEVGARVVVSRAAKVEIDGAVGTPQEGPAFETS